MAVFCSKDAYSIAKKYSVPYMYVVCMMHDLKCREKSNQFYVAQLDIPNLHTEVIKFLWKRRTVARIVELFDELYDRVQAMEEHGIDYYLTHYCTGVKNIWAPSDIRLTSMTYTNLLNCWLYKALSLWVNDMSIMLENRAALKKKLFDIAMTKETHYYG